jgi:hypothetical protein
MSPRSVVLGTMVVSVVSVALSAQPASEAATWKDTDIGGCRAGRASSCEALGYPKPLARRLAAYLRQPRVDKRQAEFEQVSAEDDLIDAIARLDPEPALRSRATGLLRDPSLLSVVIEHEPVAAVREVAIRSAALVDQELLARVARTDWASSVRYAAVIRLDEVDSVAGALRADADAGVRVLLAKRLTNETTLAELVRGDEPAVALAAAANPRLSSQEVLAALMESPIGPTVREVIAAKRFFPTAAEATESQVAIGRSPDSSPATAGSGEPLGVVGTGSSGSGGGSDGSVYVKGYRRRDGTYVAPHTRRAPRSKK